MNTDASFHRTLEARVLFSLITRMGQRHMEDVLNTHDVGISGLQVAVMGTLTGHRFTLSELSRMFGMDPSTLVPVIESLVRKGMLERGKDPTDRRRVPLLLTDKAQETMGQLMPLLQENDALHEALQRFGDEKTEQLLSLMRDLIALMPEGEETLAKVYAGMEVRRQGMTGHTPENCTPDAPNL